MANDVLAELRNRYHIADAWRDLGLAGQPPARDGRVCSPFRPDRTPSFSISMGGTRWKDFGEGGPAGDVFALVMRAQGSDFRAAVDWIRERLGLPKPSRGPARPELHAGSHGEIRQLAALRGFPAIAGLETLNDRGLLRFGSIEDDSRVAACWFVTDSSGLNLQARRLDGAPLHVWDAGVVRPVKAKTMRDCRAGWPVGAADVSEDQAIVMVEGGPDLLAAAHFGWWELGADLARVAFVAMLGAGQHIPDDALERLAGRRVRVIVQADPAGRTGAMRWAAQLRGVGCTVDGFDCTGLMRPDGKRAKDLADLARWPMESWHESSDPELDPPTSSFRHMFDGFLGVPA